MRTRDADQVVEAQMALALKPASAGAPATKMLDTVTQADAGSDYTVFRGIERMFIIPFGTHSAITAADTRIGQNLELPHLGISNVFGTDASDGNLAGLVTNNNSHLYRNVILKVGTSAVLAYGKAPDKEVAATPSDSVAYKHRNGVLRPSGLVGAETPADISFSLEPFVNSGNQGTVNSIISGLLTYLNSIANARDTYYGYYYFYNYNTTGYQDIANFFKSFTNEGSKGSSGLAFSGSTRVLAVLLSDLYNSANTLYNSSSSAWTRGMCDGIMDAIDNSTYATVSGTTVTLKSPYADFPESFGVPDGAISIQWNGDEFVQVSAASSAIAPIDAYCYPPSLWYWVNSTLLTSDEEDVDNEYKSSNPTWASILGHYTLGITVRPGVTSTAVKDPLQYGVAMLKLIMEASSSPGGTSDLLDSKANTVSILGNVFPLTGIIVGEQRNQYYNFTPVSTGTMYVYDTDVDDGGTPKAYIRYNDTGFKPIHTLLVQTDHGEDVHYALEFRNDSGAAFYGVNGCIIPSGGKFYLIGTLALSEASSNAGGIDCVFLQDHVTQANVTVKSLAQAYNVIPELRDPQLEIGVRTEMQWVGSTPSEIPMY